ncbi:phosphohydrolase [Vibrio sp. qd031]|nr:phosphohydrolase [Vibrio sp. qd031]
MLNTYRSLFEQFILAEMVQDPAHDINHVRRVVKTALSLSEQQHAEIEVVLPAAYLHDCFTFPKNHPDRATSSTIAAQKADAFLRSIDYPQQYLEAIEHAIIAHSYSANIKPKSLEAKIVQDSDRLDALGAIGVSRCLQVSSGFGASLYHGDDPYGEHRDLDDKAYAIDHFQTKLFKLADLLHTNAAKREAKSRIQFMEHFLEQLNSEM